MGKAFLYGSGGGGAGLNFRIFGGLTAPGNPKENDIWAYTNIKVTAWAFFVEEPAEPVEGMLWILQGTSSSVTFNVLKKNVLQVYPLSAKQYDGSVWVEVPVQSYRAGEWTNWATYIYSAGGEYNKWIAKALRYVSGTGASAPVITATADGLEMAAAVVDSGGVVHYEDKIDLTAITKLRFEGAMTGGVDWCRFCVWSDFGSLSKDNIAAEVQAPVDGTVELDVSGLSGLFYVGFLLYQKGTTVKMKNLSY